MAGGRIEESAYIGHDLKHIPGAGPDRKSQETLEPAKRETLGKLDVGQAASDFCIGGTIRTSGSDDILQLIG